MRGSVRTVVGVDLGGTHLRAAAVSRTGEIVGAARSLVNGRMPTREILASVAACVREAASGRDPAPEGVGLIVPGGVDERTGIVTVSPNYPRWRNLDLARPLRDELKMPVAVANDNNAAALGEMWKGDTRNADTFIYIAMGTGVGGGIVIGGKLHAGANGMAGEVGHITVDPRGPRCGCGRRGCLEMFASGRAIARMAMAALDRRDARVLRAIARAGDGRLEGEDVRRAADLGDPCAKEVFRVMGRSLGSALADLIAVLNPPLIILGGKVSRSWRLFMPAARAAIAESAFRLPARSCRIARSRLVDRSGILGAARMAWDRIEGGWPDPS